MFSDSKNVSLSARWILVTNNGSLIIGSEACPYQHKAVITLTGARTTNSEMGSDPLDGIPFGTKGIAIANGGTLELHVNSLSFLNSHFKGALANTSWTNLAATANIGATTLTLAAAVNWKVGDKIVIASTDFTAYSTVVPDQNEYRAIKAISGNVITLDTPLSYMHWGAGYERAEVGLLTRNIVISGTNESTNFGGHVNSISFSKSNL